MIIANPSCPLGHPASLGCGCGDAPPRITDEAWGLVMEGDRQAAYGHPASDFKATGRIWGAILERWFDSLGYPEVHVSDVPPRLVALMLTAVKLSRESANPKHDNRVDGIGYWLCADRIVEGY